MPASIGQGLRRSSRVPVQLPIHVTSLEPNVQFSEVCETMVVNAHGCSLRSPIQLSAGSVLQLNSREGRQAIAHVVHCQSLGSNGEGWSLGARLDQPDNLWGLKSFPDDWRFLDVGAHRASDKQAGAAVFLPKGSGNPSQAILEKVEQHLSEERLRGIMAKLVKPMQAELNELHEKMARGTRQNRFEVSLGQIPPELEEKLWERLRKDLGAQVLQQTKEQSAEILACAKESTDQKIGAALNEFRNRLSGELHAAEQRTKDLSKEMTSSTQAQVRAGVEKLQQQALEAGAQLGAQSEKLMSSLEHRLSEAHQAHRRELEQLHADATQKASSLHADVVDVNQRIEKLNQSVRHLESDLDAHLGRIAGEIISTTQSQLEAAVAQALKEFQARGSNEVDARIDEVCTHLRSVQNRIEHSFSGSLTAQLEEAVQTVSQKFDGLAHQSMERWRGALAKDLNSVAQSLGQQVRKEFDID